MEYFLNNIKTNINDYRVNTSNTKNGANSLSAVQENLTGNNVQNLRDDFTKVTQKSGLIEKFYNYIKNKTGLGIGSKKIEQKILELQTDKVSKDEVNKKISDFRVSQENSAQNLGDLAAASLALTGYFKWANFASENKARAKVNALPWFMEYGPFKEVVKSKVAILPALMIAGGLAKVIVLSLNQIGSKKLKIENAKKMDKKELHQAKKERNRNVRKAIFRNFATGTTSALLAPLAPIAGGVVGVPLYLASVFGIRYYKSKNDGKDKSFTDFKDNFKNNSTVNSAFALVIGVPALKKAQYRSVLNKNLNKVVSKLKDVKLNDIADARTSYDEIRDIMLSFDKIKSILKDTNLDVNIKIKKLTDENIFAVKFLQILEKDEISSALKENCPPSRNLDEAQKEINKLISSDKYKVSKLLGVGTVAESYLAKDQSGKEVCIKILKDGINADKIQKDKEAFIKLVIGDSPKGKWNKAQEYLIRNIENLAEGISKEVDFENEAKAAEKLRKHTKKADVVVPIEAKPGIYVMEKAPGISLETFTKYYLYEYKIKRAEKAFKPDQQKIDNYKKKIEELKAKSPEFKDFKLSSAEINMLLTKYSDILVEQFTKVDKNGKTIHADIHPGNIFINIEALKNKKGKFFTLIDTGNTIDLTKEQALSSIKLSSYIQNGNVKDLIKCSTEDAILPQGMSQEKAQELMEKDLKEIFFDDKTKIKSMNGDTFFALTNYLMRKHDIIPNDTQLNLNKAKKSADISLNELGEAFLEKKYGVSDMNNAATFASAAKDIALILAKYESAKKLQESKNLIQMPFKEAISYMKNPNMLKTNSEEHLIYKFKQDMKIDSNDNQIYE